jgi:hypothetical protein
MEEKFLLNNQFHVKQYIFESIPEIIIEVGYELLFEGWYKIISIIISPMMSPLWLILYLSSRLCIYFEVSYGIPYHEGLK